jgi:hypothetical protein
MLAAMDEDGFVQFASVANLAYRARVTVEECSSAVESFEGPDPNSGDPENAGQRIEKVPGGWMVLNAKKYRDIVTREVAKNGTRERVARFRAKKRNAAVTTSNVLVTPSDTDTDTESDTDLRSISGLDAGAWRDWEAYREKRKPAIKSASRQKAMEAMAALGDGQRAAVDHSIANGYQGLIAPKAGANGNGRILTRYEKLTADLDRQIAEGDEALARDDGPVRGALAPKLRPAAIGHMGKPDRGAR